MQSDEGGLCERALAGSLLPPGAITAVLATSKAAGGARALFDALCRTALPGADRRVVVRSLRAYLAGGADAAAAVHVWGAGGALVYVEADVVAADAVGLIEDAAGCTMRVDRGAGRPGPRHRASS